MRLHRQYAVVVLLACLAMPVIASASETVPQCAVRSGLAFSDCSVSNSPNSSIVNKNSSLIQRAQRPIQHVSAPIPNTRPIYPTALWSIVP